MRRSLVLFATVIAAMFTCGASDAVEYFPTDPAATFDYTYGPVTIVDLGADGIARVVCATCIVSSSSSYLIDTGGDVLATEYGASAQAAPDPDIYLYTPNLKYLDFPLDTGKTWESTAALYYYMGGDAIDTVTLNGRVVGPNTVTVPAGDFEVIEVELNYQYAVETWRSTTSVLWLHRQLGPVNGLEAWTGVIPTETPTWGTLKASYR